MSNEIRICCVLIFLAVSCIPAFGQSVFTSANRMAGNNSAGPDPSKTSPLESELSAAILTPCTIVGTTSGNFDDLIDVIVTTPDLVGSPTYAKITWASGTCTTATTCTIIFQNPPPGPAQVGLSANPVAPSNWMDVSGSPLVIFKGDTPAATWFPAGVSPSSAYSYMFVQAVGQWYSSEDKTKASGYPSLQWQPGAVTIIYQ